MPLYLEGVQRILGHTDAPVVEMLPSALNSLSFCSAHNDGPLWTQTSKV
jgi:hypothetical protein